MTRRAIFDAVRLERGKPWTPAEIHILDEALDRLGVAPETPETTSDQALVSKAGIDLIKEFEGCHKLRSDGSIEAYPDPGSGGDPWTIGWGSTGNGIKRGTVWTQQMADARLERDVADFAARVASLIGPAATLQHEFDAMVSLAYNVGTGNFGSSTLLKKHKAGNKMGAASEFGRWNKASGKVMAGLTRRRGREADMYRGT